MPEVLMPFKDANQVDHNLRAWQAAGSETQVVMIADPTSGTQRNLAIDADGRIGINALPALPAGTSAIGKLAANSGVDIGDVDVLSLPALPAGTNNIGDVDVLSLPALPTGANTIGKADQGVGGASAWKVDGSAVTQPISIAATVVTKETRASTPTQASVAASASSVTILAANANRLGATVYNDSTVNLFLKLGATASATSFTVKIAAAGYYEVPFNYTGIIDGIWDSATGSARITELAA